MERSVWIGWEPREASAFAVARHSIMANGIRHPSAYHIRGVLLSELRRRELYWRPHSQRGHQLWDDISDAPMATEFACSRFLVPALVKLDSHPGYGNRWAVFMDCDMLVRTDINRLFDAADPSKAVMVVKHNHRPEDGSIKMDGQIQTRYSRKNWSSVCLFNVDHPANEALTVDLVNTVPGRDLHAFCWLDDDLIGELGPEWNYLVGHSKAVESPAIVHFTDGIPHMKGYEDCEYAEEWRRALDDWAMR